MGRDVLPRPSVESRWSNALMDSPVFMLKYEAQDEDYSQVIATIASILRADASKSGIVA
jgi:hypothetical protein